MKKIKEFFFSNVFVRSKVIICWIIVAIGVLTVALLLAGCSSGVRNYVGAWSPDGTKIAYSSTCSGNSDIWVMDADGSNKINLTDIK